jgi:hypothetical protein
MTHRELIMELIGSWVIDRDEHHNAWRNPYLYYRSRFKCTVDGRAV